MVVTSRTLTWLGLTILFITGVTLGILVMNAPPAPALIALFIGYLGMATFGLVMTMTGLFQHLRGRSDPGGILRESALAGIVAVVIITLQYQELLTWPLGLVILLAAIIVEISVHLYLQHQKSSAASTGSRSASRPQAPHTRQKPKSRSKS